MENDLAISAAVAPEGVKFKNAGIPSELFCTKSNLYQGWEIFYLGYPVNRADHNLFPIVRSGIVSAFNLPQPNEILIDALVSAGNSGGPCFLN